MLKKITDESLDSLIKRFHDSAIIQIEEVEKNPKKANRNFDILESVFQELRRRGGDAIVAFCQLMDDPEPAVRLWAASEYLDVDPSRPAKVLEELSDSLNVFIKMSAAMTLGYWRDPNFMPSF